jgi:hypothetical protein
MGWGLGKNSPIVLSLGRENYEAMIARHGQWVRWRIAKKCICVTATNQPDIHCLKCNGSGEVYDYQKEFYTTLRVNVSHNNILELPQEYAQASIEKIYDHRGIDYEHKRFGLFAQLSTARNLYGELVDIVVHGTLLEHVAVAELKPCGSRFYKVAGVESPQSSIAGVSYQAPGEVIHIERIVDTEGREYEIEGYRADMVQLKDLHSNTTNSADNKVCIIKGSMKLSPGNEDPTSAIKMYEKESYVGYSFFISKTVLTAYKVTFIKPYRFVVLSQDLRKKDAEIVQAAQGDALATVPYQYNVSIGDIITVLSGTFTDKRVVIQRGSGDTVLPELFVEGIDSLESAEEVYKEGRDFVITGMNRIHWIGEKRPEAQSVLSIIYRYYPTYRVVQNYPTLRTSEDQRLPRKVILAIFNPHVRTGGA